MRNRRIALGIILFATLLVYAQSLGHGFVQYDDNLLIYENPNVLTFSLQTMWNVFTSYDPELYIPVTFLSHQFEHLFFGISAPGYHVVSLVLHLISVLLVFWISNRLGEAFADEETAGWIGITTAALFALHPINVEAVAWAAARKDLLSGTLFLATAASYLRYRDTESRLGYWLSIVIFFLALGSKVTAVTLPFALLLVDWFRGRKIDRYTLKEKIPYFGLSVLFVVIAFIGKSTQISTLSMVEKAFLSAKNVAFTLSTTIFPTKLTVLHVQPFPPIEIGQDMLISALVLIGLLAVILLTYRKQKIIAFGLSFFLLTLVPSFESFFKSGYVYFAAERYAYVPIVGLLFLIAALAVPRINRKVLIATLLIICFIFGYLSWRQTQTWKDSRALYERVLSIYPYSNHAWSNYGTVMYEEGDLEGALESYKRALEIDTRSPQTHGNLGIIYYKQGDLKAAETAFREGMDSIPDYRPIIEVDLNPFFLLASLLDETGRSVETVAILERAQEIGPQFFYAQYDLGLKYQQLGRWQEAYDAFMAATEIYPKHVEAHYRLAAVAGELGRIDDAIEAMERVVRLDPDYARAKEHLFNMKKLRGR